MTVRERQRSGTLADFSVLFQLVITYRMPMMVSEVVVFSRWYGEELYYRCPRCQELLERDSLAYCSRCGQCLDWSNYKRAKRTVWKQKLRT